MSTPLIAIDAGHGKDGDPGAVGPSGLQEAEVTNRLAELLQEELKQEGWDPWLTDRSLLSSQRAVQAQEAGGSLLVSLHCNAAGAEAQGIETWYAHEQEEGKKLAEHLQEELVRTTGRRDRGVKDDYDWRPAIDPSWTGGMGVLRGFPGPACLVELLFISNPEEERLLTEDSFLQESARAIARGIRTSLGEPNSTPISISIPTDTPDPKEPFPDLPADLWQGAARRVVLSLKEKGVLTGYADGTFRPQQPMTRLEGAVALYRVLQLLGKPTREGR